MLDLNSPFPAVRTRLGGVLAAECVTGSCLATSSSLLSEHVVLAEERSWNQSVGRKRSKVERSIAL